MARPQREVLILFVLPQESSGNAREAAGAHGLGIMARLRGGGGGDGDCGCPSQCLANRLEFRE